MISASVPDGCDCPIAPPAVSGSQGTRAGPPCGCRRAGINNARAPGPRGRESAPTRFAHISGSPGPPRALARPAFPIGPNGHFYIGINGAVSARSRPALLRLQPMGTIPREPGTRARPQARAAQAGGAHCPCRRIGGGARRPGHSGRESQTAHILRQNRRAGHRRGDRRGAIGHVSRTAGDGPPARKHRPFAAVPPRHPADRRAAPSSPIKSA